ncbi:terminase family protein [Amylibacter sp. IMCC11727]|uniref:DNA-packaging protein n=1 Tax=Amylibacter sp. IMCC11727 TaxID=3039851 RepID=UPI00244DB2FF|nr:terminase family protein [Amylibacter sp. IMCC11727]WGI20843.1 terminase family protein [Amylibacter sp. IMCC11727]
MPSTSTMQDVKSLIELLGSASEEEVDAFLKSLSDETLQALPYLFEFWALPHQLEPAGDWSTWVILGGRGAGKTRAGAEWVRSKVEGAGPADAGQHKRVALIGETLDQVREVMVFGDSGIIANSPPDRVPEWHAARRALVWPNGAEAWAMSASSPEHLRGPQFDCVWADELGKWKKARDTWDMMQFALRLGEDPRALVTTTPRNIGILKEILEADDTVATHAPTEANRANLAPSFLKKVYLDYGGSRLGKQELDGKMIEDVEGALWPAHVLDGLQKADVPEMDRIIVAVDPPASGKSTADACGIIVAGVQTHGGGPEHWKAWVLADESVRGASPAAWAKVVADTAKTWQADRVVAEVNQGGDMVEAVLRQQAPMLAYRAVHATRGKTVRAEPVAALYEQGRVCHAKGLRTLEDQMAEMTLTGFAGKGSPDRVDALVWALTDLMIDPAASFTMPRIKRL